jgi:hypothetical protein
MRGDVENAVRSDTGDPGDWSGSDHAGEEMVDAAGGVGGEHMAVVGVDVLFRHACSIDWWLRMGKAKGAIQ